MKLKIMSFIFHREKSELLATYGQDSTESRLLKGKITLDKASK